MFFLLASPSAFAEQKGTVKCTGSGLTLELKLNGTCDIAIADGGCLTVNGEHITEYPLAILESTERIVYSGRHIAHEHEYSIIIPNNFKPHFESYVEDFAPYSMPQTVPVVCDVTK